MDEAIVYRLKLLKNHAHLLIFCPIQSKEIYIEDVDGLI